MISLEEMEELEKKATPRPWKLEIKGSRGKYCLTINKDLFDEISNEDYYNSAPKRIEDIEFLEASREFVPWACAEIRRLRAIKEVDDVDEMFRFSQRMKKLFTELDEAIEALERDDEA